MSAVILLKIKFKNDITKEDVSEYLFHMFGVASKNRLALELYEFCRTETFYVNGKKYEQHYKDIISPQNEIKIFISDSYIFGFAEKFMETRIWADYDREKNRKNVESIYKLLKFVADQKEVDKIEIWFDEDGDVYISESNVDCDEKLVKIEEFMSIYLDYLEAEKELGAYIKFIIEK